MLNATRLEVTRINDLIRRNNMYYWAVFGRDMRPRPGPAEGC